MKSKLRRRSAAEILASKPKPRRPLRAAHPVSTQRKKNKEHLIVAVSEMTVSTVIPNTDAGLHLLDVLERVAEAQRLKSNGS